MNYIRFLLMRGRIPHVRTIVHVGAHFGQEAHRYQNWGAKKVVWFEAFPDIYEKLVVNLKNASMKKRKWPFQLIYGNAKTEHVTSNALLADESGKIFTFHLFNNGGASNSIFPLSEHGSRMFPGLKETGQTVQIESRQLDEELIRNDISFEEVDVLILDVQGAELKVLIGATETLKHVKLLELEASSEEVYKDGVLVNELDEWLLKRGFSRRTRMRRAHMNVIYSRI